MEEEKDEKHIKSEPDIFSSKEHEDAVNIEGKDDKKYPYPKSVLFIISTEFCERFSYYGMKSKFMSTKIPLIMIILVNLNLFASKDLFN